MLLSRKFKQNKYRCFPVQFNYEPPFGFQKGCVLWFRPISMKKLVDGDIVVMQCLHNNGYALKKVRMVDGEPDLYLEGGEYNFGGPTFRLLGIYAREAWGKEKTELINEADEKFGANQTKPLELFFTRTPVEVQLWMPSPDL